MILLHSKKKSLIWRKCSANRTRQLSKYRYRIKFFTCCATLEELMGFHEFIGHFMGDVMQWKTTKKFNQGTFSSGLKLSTALCYTTMSSEKALLFATVSADWLWRQCYFSVIVAYCILMHAIDAIVWTVKYGD